MKKHLKPILSVLVLVTTIAAFIYYFVTHPAAREQIKQIPPLTLGILLILYGVFLISLVWIQSATLRLCDTKLDRRENVLLTIYSSIVNFFGPLQSGPGFRAVYLKQKHGTKLKNYTIATLLYYLFFAGCSGLFLLSGFMDWRLLLVLLVAALIVLRFLLRTNIAFIRRFQQLHLKSLYKLAFATAFQVSIVAFIYFVELHSVDRGVHFSQAIIYTGAANFALFVSLTPGAIGFRESFLLFSQHLHHIDKSSVLSASLIDRSVYVIFLGLLFLLVLSMHAKERLDVKKVEQAQHRAAQQ